MYESNFRVSNGDNFSQRILKKLAKELAGSITSMTFFFFFLTIRILLEFPKCGCLLMLSQCSQRASVIAKISVEQLA